MLITKTLKIKLGSNRKYYTDLGYNTENVEISIDVNHLSKGSHNLVEVKCDICNTQKTIEWKRYIDNISKCNLYTCSSKCARIKVETSNMEKYGVKNVSSIPAIRDKAKKTMFDKYGVEYGMQTEESKFKYKQTCLDKYGVENVSQSEEVQRKVKKTNLKRFGCEYSFGSEIIKERIKDSLNKKYGDVHFSKTKEVIDKKKKINLERYGVEYYLQTKECVERSRIAFKKKYGVDWITQNEDIRKGIIIKSKNTNELNTFNKYKNILEIKYDILSYNESIFNMYHKKCENNFTINVKILNERLKYNENIEICTICKPLKSFTSSHENNVCILLDEINVKYIKSDRTVLEGKELDIYIPDYNLAIEFNGLYWHSELHKDKKYHLNKSLECEKKGIHLIHIFEDDWIHRYEIIRSIILNKLNKIQNKIYARKCEIREVKSKEAIRFLNDNHIQGGCMAKYKLGLYFENELTSLMTFGYRHTNSKKEFELIRFCNKINTNVIGASSKLFKHFIKNYQIEEKCILSYSDLSLFDGGMYEVLGFKEMHLSKPNYFWVIDNIRHHRFKFNKQKLIKEGFDPLKTEVQIMHDRGYYRIYGCGQVRWEYKL